MSDLVVDSCVAVKLVLPEPDTAQAQNLLTAILARGGGTCRGNRGQISWKATKEGKCPPR